MSLSIPLARPDQRILLHLEQRDRNALLLYVVSGTAVVVAGEAIAFYLDVVNRFGFLPLLLRGIAYLLLTTALWAALLRANRRTVFSLLEEKRQGYETLLLAYDSAVALKDAYTGGHGRRVARYARLIAEAMGQSEADLDSVAEAALLHDLGKIGIPDRILTKPERLTREEFAVVQKHPAAGADILRTIAPLRRHAKAVRHHHERFDGSGYPDGLRGTDIPVAARIIAVADAFDALGSNRSYRRGVSAEQALDIIAQAGGSHFDPEIVAAAAGKPLHEALIAAHGEMP